LVHLREKQVVGVRHLLDVVVVDILRLEDELTPYRVDVYYLGVVLRKLEEWCVGRRLVHVQ